MRFCFAAFFFIVITLLMSCEGHRCGVGTVLDKVTNAPLDSVLCEALTGTQKVYSNSGGKFEVCNRISGCVPKCKDITVRFSKSGYKTITLDNPEAENIYMER